MLICIFYFHNRIRASSHYLLHFRILIGWDHNFLIALQAYVFGKPCRFCVETPPTTLENTVVSLLTHPSYSTPNSCAISLISSSDLCSTYFKPSK